MEMTTRLRFRDGERDLPNHLAVRMAKMNVRVLTYDAAIAAVNRAEMADYLNREQQRVIADHFRRQSG
jgi:hypothetical protein